MARTMAEVLALQAPGWVNTDALRYAWETLPGWRQQAHDCHASPSWVQALTKEAKKLYKKEIGS